MDSASLAALDLLSASALSGAGSASSHTSSFFYALSWAAALTFDLETDFAAAFVFEGAAGSIAFLDLAFSGTGYY